MLVAFSNWLGAAPLWIIGFAITAGLFASATLGGLLRRRLKSRASDPDSDHQAITVSSVMGLLALLVAFTFSIAIERFDTRRLNVLNEANAIGTTYLRAQLLDEPHRARISALLIDYTNTRVVLATSQHLSQRRALLNRSDALIAELWTATVAAFPTMRQYDFSTPFLDSMNNLIDMDAVRKAGRDAHVPATVFLALFLYQFVAVGLVGFVVAGKASRRTAWVLFALLGLLLLLIIDIDRPTSGGITESQEPMLQLQSFLRKQPPETFDRLNASARK